MLKNILKIKGIHIMNTAEQKTISGGVAGICKIVYGNTGQNCSTSEDCDASDMAVCHEGCCNTWV